MSWQSNTPSIDFVMLEKRLKETDPDIETVMLTKKLKKSFSGLFAYYFHMYRQMHQMASSSVLVLDSYVPAVSILNHKEDLYVIQLWHALGAIKKFSLQSVGTQGGRTKKQADRFDMHKNYSVIISSSEKTSGYYSEAFGYPIDKMKVCGLPRIDYLLDNKEEIRERILIEYPELSGSKKNILYAPTFRNNRMDSARDLIEVVDFDKYNLIIKPHHRQDLEDAGDSRVISPEGYLSMELLTVTDNLITDYSAISLEAAVLNVPTLYYLYDYNEYKKDNGLNIDIYDIFREQSFTDARQLNDLLDGEAGESDYLRREYLPKELGHSTDAICRLITNKLKEHTDK